MTATPSLVVSGAKSVIAWTSTNTTSCNADVAARTKGVSGTFTTAALTTGTSYSVTCVGPKGSSTSSVYVGISSGTGSSSGYNNGINTPTVTVNATPLSVESGSSSDISWISTNATSCNANVTGRTKGTSGTFNTGALTKGKEYSVICIGTNGSSSGNVIVSVIGENDPPIVSAIATPSSIVSGAKSVITWTSKNTTSCNADVTTRTKGTSGTFTTAALTSDTAYSVTCVGPNGSGSTTVYVFINTNGVVTTCPYGGTPPNCLNAPIGSSSYNNICINGADNYPTCTTLNGVCVNNATNPPACTTASTTTTPTTIQTCQDLDVLDFTAEQTAEITDLLKRYYLLADKLKTDNDIISANNDADKTKSIINQAQTLTQQCVEQTSSPSYTGPKQLGPGNPYYKSDSYLASIWPIDPFNPPLNAKIGFDINGKGFAPLANAEDTFMGTGSYYIKKLQDNYLNWPSSSANPNAWKSTYMNSFADWASLNAQTAWDQKKSEAEEATTTVIESLFRIW